jgi:prepilin-type N-terminal cleavage/methylation domain-containing protein
MRIQTLHPQAARRAAFTLMEVLVVVAIVVIMASVGTIGVLRYLENAKYNQAEQQMMNLATVEKTQRMKNNGEPLQDITALAPYLERGEQALIDPWGNMYQMNYISVVNALGEEELRAQFSTVQINPETGEPVYWPK